MRTFQSSDRPAPNVTTAPQSEAEVINAALEPELREVSGAWNAAKRFAVAEKFRRWSNQLAGTAIQLQAVEKLNQPGHQIQN